MGAPVTITRDEHTATELRAASARCTDGGQVRRVLALALVLEGRARSEAAALNGMDRQTLSDWVRIPMMSPSDSGAMSPTVPI